MDHGESIYDRIVVKQSLEDGGSVMRWWLEDKVNPEISESDDHEHGVLAPRLSEARATLSMTPFRALERR